MQPRRGCVVSGNSTARGRTSFRELTIRFARDRGFVDSPLEEAGFEPLVPPSKRTAVPELARSFFAASCTGYDRLVSENADFEL
jgi:hypothetical protein